MPKIKHEDTKFGTERLSIIGKANEIIAEYQQQGYELTLRQLDYQFVSRDIIANTQREYKNLGETVNAGRMAGMIDWNAIVDRTRALDLLAHWGSPEEIVRSCAAQFRYDKWEGQPRRVEVWVEKEALAGIVERAARRFDVPFLSCRGYTSQSEMWGAGQRLLRHIEAGQEPYIIHLGDHDPSGIDMSRDIQDRLGVFCGQRIEFKRIALNMDQVEEHEPPPNPAKITDSRATGYIERFGSESWELDALEPSVLDGLITSAIEEVLHHGEFDMAEERQQGARDALAAVAAKWEDVVGFCADGKSEKAKQPKKKGGQDGIRKGK